MSARNLQRQSHKHKPGEVQHRIYAIDEAVVLKGVQIQSQADVADKIHKASHAEKERRQVARSLYHQRKTEASAQCDKTAVNVEIHYTTPEIDYLKHLSDTQT